MQANLQTLAETGKSMMDSMKQLGEINFNLVASLSQQQVDMVGIYLESGNKSLQALSEVKDLPSAVAQQTKLAEDLTKKVIHNASVTVDVLTDAKAQLSGWAEKWLDLNARAWQAVQVKV